MPSTSISQNYNLRFDSVTKTFHRDGWHVAVDDVSFDAPAGAFTTIVGPSGCGKSTLLNMAAGILGPSKGQIKLNEQEVSGINPNVGFVTQDSNLFPWLTLYKNIAFPLTLRGHFDKSEIPELVDKAISQVGLSGFADHYPYELSGGMQKRASIARTLVYDPQVILMDEPFGSVDAITRLNLQMDLLSLWEEHRKTILFITHDLGEAILLSDYVIIMTRSGKIKKIFEVPLARPRQAEGLQGSREYATVYDDIWKIFREEVVSNG